MTKKYLIPVGALLAAGLLPASSLAMADGKLGLDINTSADVHIESRDSDNESVRSTTSADATLRVESEDRGDNQGAGESSQSGEHKSENIKQNEDKGDKGENGGGENDNEIEIDHRSAVEASTTIDKPEHVSNRGQLRSFLNHLIKEDDHIADVKVSTTTVETHYNMSARFFGFIPASLNTDVRVNADGSVTVTYPWYAFLFRKNSDLLNKLTQSAASSSAGVSTSVSLSASTQAHLLNLIFSTLKESN